MATKYKEYFDLMLKNNTEVFTSFKKLESEYMKNPGLLQEKLNQEGANIQRIVYQWQDKLCNRAESNGYASFTSNLAEKFLGEVRKEFPHFDSIGISVFNIKKISL